MEENVLNNLVDHSFIIWDKSYTVKDENELSLIFELLWKWDSDVTSVLHWNVIMELDDVELMKIIKTNRWLLSCLKHLNEKNYFLLLVKVWDKLSEIVKNSMQLGEILAKIAEENNKLRLIKQIRTKWLARLILTSEDLINILEWVYNEAERETLNTLWEENIRKLFIYPKDIYSVLHYLNSDNKDYLINMIWLNDINKKISSWTDFMFMIKWMSYQKLWQFLQLYTRRQIKDMFSTDEEFRSFLFKLSDKKEKMILEYLWIKD